jgi:hypothetical protein
METRHPEGGESPFMAREDSSAVAITTQNESSDIDYINCPVVGCGEAFLLTELEGHVEMHEEEQGGSEDEDSSRGSKRMNLVTGPGETFDTKLSYALRNLGDEDDERDGDATLEREHELYEQQFGDGKSYERRRTSQDIETVSSTKYAIKSAKAAWRDFLKIPPSDRKSTSSSSIKTRRRLGVRIPPPPESPVRNINSLFSEIRIGPPCAREADAGMADKATGRRRCSEDYH